MLHKTQWRNTFRNFPPFTTWHWESTRPTRPFSTRRPSRLGLTLEDFSEGAFVETPSSDSVPMNKVLEKRGAANQRGFHCVKAFVYWLAHSHRVSTPFERHPDDLCPFLGLPGRWRLHLPLRYRKNNRSFIFASGLYFFWTCGFGIRVVDDRMKYFHRVLRRAIQDYWWPLWGNFGLRVESYVRSSICMTFQHRNMLTCCFKEKT